MIITICTGVALFALVLHLNYTFTNHNRVIFMHIVINLPTYLYMLFLSDLSVGYKNYAM